MTFEAIFGYYFLGMLFTIMGIKFFFNLDIRRGEFWDLPFPMFATLLWFIAVPMAILSLAGSIPSLKQIQDKRAKDRQYRKDVVDLLSQPPYDPLEDHFKV